MVPHSTEFDDETEPALRALKLVLLGDALAGKTTFRLRACHNQFLPAPGQQYDPDAEVAVSHVIEQSDDAELVTVALWDFPARQDYDTRVVAYEGISASVVIVDLTNRDTFATARRWRADVLAAHQKGGDSAVEAAAVRRHSLASYKTTLDQNFLTWATESRRLAKSCADAPAFLVGCKADLVSPTERTELASELRSLAHSVGFDGCYVVSARDDKGHTVRNALRDMITRLTAE